MANLTLTDKLYYLAIFAVALAILNWLRLLATRFWTDLRIDRMLSKIPTPPNCVPFVGHVTRFVGGEPWKIMCLDFPRELKSPIVRFNMFRSRVLLFTTPLLIQRVLQSHQRKYNKHLDSYSEFMCLLGNGLVTSEGQKWRHGRALLSSAMRIEILDHLPSIAILACDRMLTEMREHAEKNSNNNKPFDLQSGFHKLTLQVIGRALLSLEPGECENVFAKLYLPIVDECNARVWEPYRKYMFWTEGYQAHSKCLAKLDDYFVKLIQTRWAQKEKRDREKKTKGGDDDDVCNKDILDLYMSQCTSMNSDQVRQLRDDLKTMVLAGHETTAAMLTWTMYEILSNPELAKKVREEHKNCFSGKTLSNAFDNNNKEKGEMLPTNKHLENLVLTRSCLREALRKYSVVPLTMRVSNEDDFIRKEDSGLDFDMTVPQGTAIAVGITSVHNNPELWPEPRKYDPERFVKLDSKMDSVQYSFIPFITGPRHCLGQNLSLTESQFIVSYLVSHVEGLQLAESASGKPHKYIVPQVPENGLPVTFKKVHNIIN